MRRIVIQREIKIASVLFAIKECSQDSLDDFANFIVLIDLLTVDREVPLFCDIN